MKIHRLGMVTIATLLSLSGTAFADGIPDISSGAVATVFVIVGIVLFVGVSIIVQIARALDRGVEKAVAARREKATRPVFASARVVRDDQP